MMHIPLAMAPSDRHRQTIWPQAERTLGVIWSTDVPA
jgi:hypothetical protein